MTLTVRHGIAKGIGDKGFLRLKAPKTMSSYRTVDIPEVSIPTIKTHLATRPAEPETTIIEAIHGGIMHPNTLRAQFDKAKIAAGRPDLHFQTLRVTFVTGIIHQGDPGLGKRWKSLGAPRSAPSTSVRLASTKARPPNGLEIILQRKERGLR